MQPLRTIPSLQAAVVVLSMFLTMSCFAQDVEEHADGDVVRVVLVDGTSHAGTIVSRSDSTLVLAATSGVRLTIPLERIRRIESLEGVKFQRRDPNRSRLFFAPTARPVPHGTGYVAIYEIFFPFVAVGVRDVATIAGGMSLVPGASEQALYLAPKVTVYTRRNLSVGAGGLVGTTTGGEGSAGLVFALGTFGRADAAVTAGVGLGFLEGEFSTRPLFLLAGEYQISNTVKLLSENYVIPAYKDAILASAGIRFFGDRLAADLGLMTLPTLLDEMEGFPFIPWLGFAYNFGNE